MDEQPQMLSFSPNAEALVALGSKGRTVYLWTRTSGSLNEWTLRDRIEQEGHVVALQWFGERRTWLPSLRRSTAKGPRIPHPSFGSLIVVTDKGQVTVACGTTLPSHSGAFRKAQRKLFIEANQRLRHAAIGLVADESLALLAYTTRLSSNCVTGQRPSGGDTLGMFFDDADDQIAQPDQRSAALSDGQDTIEIVEFRIEHSVSDDNPLVSWRHISPIFTASLEDPQTPSTSDINQMMWIYGDPVKNEGILMRLFTSFHNNQGCVLRCWDLKREESDRLSNAFLKLDSSKKNVQQELDEDWVIQPPLGQTFEGFFLSDFHSGRWASDRLMCLESNATRGSKEECRNESGDSRIAILDINDFKIDVQNKKWSPFDRTACQLAVSPHCVAVAGFRNGRLSVLPLELISKDVDDTHIWTAAVLQGNDLSDLTLTLGSTDSRKIEDVLEHGTKLKAHQALQLTSLECRQSSSRSHRLMCREILDLVFSFRIVSEAERDGNFSFESIWILVSRLEWVLDIVGQASKQAHCFLAKEHVLSPPADIEQKSSKASRDNMLSLLCLDVPRNILVRIISKLIRFSNWLDSIIEDGNSNSDALRAVVKASRRYIASEPDTASQVVTQLYLCQSRVHEILLDSVIDLSRAGRCLGQFSKQSQIVDESIQQHWWLAPSVPKAALQSLATAFRDSHCIRDTLALYCPKNLWQHLPLGSSNDAHQSLRDIFTKAPLCTTKGIPMKLCLVCKAVTQTNVSHHDRCICGSSQWWAMTGNFMYT